MVLLRIIFLPLFSFIYFLIYRKTIQLFLLKKTGGRSKALPKCIIVFDIITSLFDILSTIFLKNADLV